MMPAESTASKTDEGRRARNILVFSPNRNPLHDSRLLRLCAYLAGSGWAVRLMWVQGSIDRIPILPVYAQACPCVVPGRFFRDEPGKVRRLIKLLRTTWYVARALRREKSPFLWVSGLSSLALTAPYLVLHWRVRFVYDAREYSLGQHDCIGRNRKSIRQRLMICGIVTAEQWASCRASLSSTQTAGVADCLSTLTLSRGQSPSSWRTCIAEVWMISAKSHHLRPL